MLAQWMPSERTSATKPRVRAWHHKRSTGCRTCKGRRVKCDEERPHCRRCEQSGRTCGGYADPIKPWTFEPRRRAGPTTFESGLPRATWVQREQPTTSLRPRGGKVVSSDRVVASGASGSQCKHCRPRHPSSGSNNDEEGTLTAIFEKKAVDKPPSTPYQNQQEQYYLKYFLEVAAVSVSRANLSAIFWLSYFPQLAWQQPSTHYALLAFSAGFQDFSRSDRSRSLKFPRGRDAIEFESRAMRLLTKENSSVEAALAGALCFWMTSMLSGNFQGALQHAYFAQKMVTDIEDRHRYDSELIRFCESLSRSCLLYFRNTRGTCFLHPGTDMTACEPSCFEPEEANLELRVADSLCHLQMVVPKLQQCRDLLESRDIPHSHEASITRLIETQHRGCSLLLHRWTSFALQTEQAVPYTISPFDNVLGDFIEYIEKDSPNPLKYLELELRMRIILPHFVVAVSRGDRRILQDLVFITFS